MADNQRTSPSLVPQPTIFYASDSTFLEDTTAQANEAKENCKQTTALALTNQPELTTFVLCFRKRTEDFGVTVGVDKSSNTVRITGIQPNACEEIQTKLRNGDLLLGINGVKFSETPDITGALHQSIQSVADGDVIQMEIGRRPTHKCEGCGQPLEGGRVSHAQHFQSCILWQQKQPQPQNPPNQVCAVPRTLECGGCGETNWTQESWLAHQTACPRLKQHAQSALINFLAQQQQQQLQQQQQQLQQQQQQLLQQQQCKGCGKIVVGGRVTMAHHYQGCQLWQKSLSQPPGNQAAESEGVVFVVTSIKQAQLGIRLREGCHGVLVTSVAPSAQPEILSQFKIGDEILQINDIPTSRSVNTAVEIIKHVPAGSLLKFLVQRKEVPGNVDNTLPTAAVNAEQQGTQKLIKLWKKQGNLGLLLGNTDRGTVMVTEYTAYASEESKEKFHIEDEILQINGTSIKNYTEAVPLIKCAPESSILTFLIRRPSMTPSMKTNKNPTQSNQSQTESKEVSASMPVQNKSVLPTQDRKVPTLKRKLNSTIPSSDKEEKKGQRNRCFVWGCPDPAIYGFEPTAPTMCRDHKLVGQKTLEPAVQKPAAFKAPNERFVNKNNPFPGWEREASVRGSGKQAGKADIYFRPPLGKKLRSRPDIEKYFAARQIDPKPLLPYFNFNPTYCTCRLKGPQEGMVSCQLGAGGCNGLLHPRCVGMSHLTESEIKNVVFTCALCKAYKKDVLPTLPTWLQSEDSNHNNQGTSAHPLLQSTQTNFPSVENQELRSGGYKF